MALKDILVALRGARDSRAALEAQLEKERARQAELIEAPPHTDDLVAWLKRSLDAAAGEYERRLSSWYFSAASKASRAGTWFETDSTVNLLAVPKASPATPTLCPVAFADHQPPDASIFALAYFLKPAIEARLADVVAKHFPEARNGIRSADRAVRLAKVRASITALEAELAELDEHLQSARREVAA